MLRYPSFLPTIFINNRTIISRQNLVLRNHNAAHFFLFKGSKQYVVSININNNEHLIFQEPIFSGVCGGCSCFFANCTSPLFLIRYNILHLKYCYASLPEQGLREGGTSYPGLGGPGRVQVSASSFGVASSGVFVGLNLSEDLFLFGALHLILGKKLE